MKTILSGWVFGDIYLQYERGENGQTGLLLLPLDKLCEYDALISKDGEISGKRSSVDSMVQLKLAKDLYNGAYAQGNTMREAESTKRLKFEGQEVCIIMKDCGSISIRLSEKTSGSFLNGPAAEFFRTGEDKKRHVFRGDEKNMADKVQKIQIRTALKDDRGYRTVHILSWIPGTPYLRIKTEFENLSDAEVTLEMISSFSLQGISPLIEGDCHGEILVHRIRSSWSAEGLLDSQSMEELGLEPSWALGAVRTERFGSIGSMPVNSFFPYIAIEDQKNHIFWGAQLETPSSWQMEIYRCDENIAADGGIADREFGHWMKKIAAKDSFMTPEAIVSVGSDATIDSFSERLTAAGKEGLLRVPESEKKLPVIFNEYCTTWGCPSHENIMNILNAIEGKGISYFVIDCGWYKADGVPWDISMGDYQVSDSLFPEGMEKTVAAIREKGMKPGIWFEIENAGPASDAYKEQTEHFLKRDGRVLTSDRRRFWNMSDPWVQNYLDEHVLGTLKKYGFEYMKVDYNDEIGIGCDGCESLGEGLRQNMQKSYEYFEKAEREIPGLILENCASGGHRLEPGYMSRCSMASFSDAHECIEIPIIAANLHRVILPQQSQIWAVIRKNDSLKRIAYTIANTFLGRMCLSGDVTDLSEDQWKVIDDGIAFYRKIAPIIRDGHTLRYGSRLKSMRHPEGWQGILRRSDQAFAVIHTFEGEIPERIEIPLPEDTNWEIMDVYSYRQEKIEIKDCKLVYYPEEKEKAAAVLLAENRRIY